MKYKMSARDILKQGKEFRLYSTMMGIHWRVLIRGVT